MDKILPDLLVSWPRHLDYPLWRQQLHDNRSLFKKVIVVFTDMHTGKDYRDFIRAAMKDDDVTFVDSLATFPDQDWRDAAVNTGLRKSKADWVFFTEQDFFWHEDFWKEATKHADVVSLISACVQGRMHPCCIIVKRKLIEEHTRKDFSVTKDVSDHFGKFQEDLRGVVTVWLSEKIYTHLGGLSQNMFLMKDPNNALYYPEEFRKYCEDSLKVSVPMHQDFERIFNEYIRRLSP